MKKDKHLLNYKFNHFLSNCKNCSFGRWRHEYGDYECGNEAYSIKYGTLTTVVCDQWEDSRVRSK